MEQLSELSKNILFVMIIWEKLPGTLFWHGFKNLEYELKQRDFKEFQYIFRSKIRKEMKILVNLGYVKFVDVRNPQNSKQFNNGYKLTEKHSK